MIWLFSITRSFIFVYCNDGPFYQCYTFSFFGLKSGNDLIDTGRVLNEASDLYGSYVLVSKILLRLAMSKTCRVEISNDNFQPGFQGFLRILKEKPWKRVWKISISTIGTGCNLFTATTTLLPTNKQSANKQTNKQTLQSTRI